MFNPNPRPIGNPPANYAELRRFAERVVDQLDQERADHKDTNDALNHAHAATAAAVAERDQQRAHVVLQYPEGHEVPFANVNRALVLARKAWGSGVETRVVNRDGQVVWSSWDNGGGFGPPDGIVRIPFDRSMPLPEVP